MRGSGIVLTDGPGVDVVVAVKGVSACSGGKRLVILTSTSSLHMITSLCHINIQTDPRMFQSTDHRSISSTPATQVPYL